MLSVNIFEWIKNCGLSKNLVELRWVNRWPWYFQNPGCNHNNSSSKFCCSNSLLLQFTATAILIRSITFSGKCCQCHLTVETFTPCWPTVHLLCHSFNLLLLQMATFPSFAASTPSPRSVSCEKREWGNRDSVDFVSVSHLVQRQTATTAASQPTNGRMTTLLMNALIICVGGGWGCLWVYDSLLVLQPNRRPSPLSLSVQLQRHIF